MFNTIPKVSIIIPVYNCSEYLGRCLNSIFCQTFTNFEVIAVDDGSDDSSLQILQEFEKRDRRLKVYTQHHKFAGEARNLGIDKSVGEFLLFLDGDDFFERNMLEELCACADHDQSDIVICSFTKFDSCRCLDAGRFVIKKKYVELSPFSPEAIKNYLFQIINPAPWNKLFRATIVKQNCIRFENTKSANDVTFVFTTMAISNKISILDRSLIHYRINQNGNISANRGKTIDCIILSMNSLKQNLLKFGVFHKFSSTFYRRVQISVTYELSHLTSFQRLLFILAAKKMTSNDIYLRSIFPLLFTFNSSTFLNRIYFKLLNLLVKF